MSAEDWPRARRRWRGSSFRNAEPVITGQGMSRPVGPTDDQWNCRGRCSNVPGDRDLENARDLSGVMVRARRPRPHRLSP
jgi:hypothetical protein